MKPFLCFLTCICFLNTLKAQSDEDSVRAAVNKLFNGMKNSDAALLKSVFTDNALLQTITNTKEGKLAVVSEDLGTFAAFIAQQPKGAADERISFGVIKIDGPLAIVWAPYWFYFNGQFSHCGVNSFQLVKINAEWKIQYLIDTRRKTGCEQ